ncbi:MAG: hypothetical protein AB7T49_15515 [Oligoflexales bacterium]
MFNVKGLCLGLGILVVSCSQQPSTSSVSARSENEERALELFKQSSKVQTAREEFLQTLSDELDLRSKGYEVTIAHNEVIPEDSEITYLVTETFTYTYDDDNAKVLTQFSALVSWDDEDESIRVVSLKNPPYSSPSMEQENAVSGIRNLEERAVRLFQILKIKDKFRELYTGTISSPLKFGDITTQLIRNYDSEEDDDITYLVTQKVKFTGVDDYKMTEKIAATINMDDEDTQYSAFILSQTK